MTNKSKKISDLPSLTPASLDTTYVVGISGSTTYKISINQLTSSLDSVFATDLAAAALSSSNAIMYQTASAASTWIFNHFLATKYPIVNVYDNNDNIIIPQSIVANNSSSLTITFSSPRTGTAVASKGGYVGSAVGNATTANALATGRLINNTLFDGTQNITIPNLVSGSTQISLAGTSDYNSLFAGVASSTASLNVFTSSINIWSSSLATTGSNVFRGNQTITGSLFVSGTILQNGGGLAVQDGTILYHSSSNWFIPTSTISNTGNIVTSVGTQFTSAMIGAKLTILRESKIITAFTSNAQVTVDSAYSQNYSSIPSGSWGVCSKAIEVKADSSIYYYDKTGGVVFGKRFDSNVYAANLLSTYGDSFYLLTNSFGINKNFTINWSDDTSGVNTKSIGLRRNTTGSLEIYDGVTADGAVANRRDLILRNITGSNASFSGSVNITGSLYSNGLSTFDGVISGSYTANNPSSSLIVLSGSIQPSASLGGASIIYANTVISASANNQTLVGLDINPQWNTGSFTGVTPLGLRIKNPGGDTITIGQNGTYSFISEIKSSGRLDLTAGNGSGQMFLNASSTMFQSSLNLNRTSDATSTANQSNSYPLVFQNSLWNGSSAFLYYNSLRTVASTTVNQLSRFSLFSSTTSTGAGGTEVFAIFNSGSVVLQNGGTFNDNGATLQVNGTNIASASLGRGVTITNTISASANSDVLVGLDINPTFTNGLFTGVSNYGLRIGGANGLRYDNPNARLTIGALAQAAQGSVHTSGQGIFEGGLAFQYDSGASTYQPNFTYSTSGGGYLNIQSWVSKPIYINNLGNNVYIGGSGGTNVTIGANSSAGYKLDVAGTTRFQGTTASDTAPLGSELAAVTGSGTNWSLAGTNLNVGGYTHATGSTTALTTSLAAVNGTYYQITYTITGRTAGSITIAYGGTSTLAFTGTSSTGPLASSTAVLTITPTTDFDGTVVLSIKSIGTSSASSTFANSSGGGIVEIRASSLTNNIFIGNSAGRRNTTGADNTILGYIAGQGNTTGTGNVFLGNGTGTSNTIGGQNTFVGISAGFANTTASYNTFVGNLSGYSNTTGTTNVALGYGALYANTIGNTNVAIGGNTLAANIGGAQNTGVGGSTLQSITNSSGNTSFGFYNLNGLTAGANNTTLGGFSGRFIADGATVLTSLSNSILIGYQTYPLANSQTNQIVIGYQTTGLGSNTTVLGNSSTTTTAIYGDLILGSTVDNGYRIQINASGSASGSLFVSGSSVFSGSINISSGSITMPNRPAFRVYGAGGATSAITTLSGSMTTIDYNQGGWDNTTGTFTAPIAGLYQVNLVCRANSNSGSAAQIVVFKNNTGGASGTAQVMIEWASNTSMNHTGGSTISKLAVGDTLKAVVSVGTITFDANDNFSVAYIG